MNLIYFFVYIYLLLKPYYIFESGSLQISDLFFVMAACLFLIKSKNNINILKKEIINNKEYVIFLILVICINLINCIKYSSFDFIIYTSYYIFNMAIILVFGFATKDNNFLKRLFSIMKLNLIIQIVIYFLGIGRWYDSFRYMGTFNDPNQLAYFVLITYCYIYILGKKFKKSTILYLILSVFLIFESVSTGILLGLLIFVFMEFFGVLVKLPKFIKENIVKIIFCCYILLIIFCGYLIMTSISPNLNTKIKNQISELKMIDRVKEKIEKSDSKNGNLLQERGYDRIYYYPEYILFGAGEGNFKRWELAYQHQEFHATLPNILFNYGIISLILIVIWMYKKIKNLPLNILIVYIALLCESFTLVNSRQGLFWAIFILGYNLYSNEKDGEDYE